MSREVRRVPKDWKHPQRTDGRLGEHFIPLYGNFGADLAAWSAGLAKWLEGLCDDFKGGWEPHSAPRTTEAYEEYVGERPDAASYMPDWPEAERTHLQMYETTSEGTPISPVMATPEELARWLADNRASAFGSLTATYEQWLDTCRRGFTPGGMVSVGGKVMSSVEYAAKASEK